MADIFFTVCMIVGLVAAGSISLILLGVAMGRFED